MLTIELRHINKVPKSGFFQQTPCIQHIIRKRETLWIAPNFCLIFESDHLHRQAHLPGKILTNDDIHGLTERFGKPDKNPGRRQRGNIPVRQDSVLELNVKFIARPKNSAIMANFCAIGYLYKPKDRKSNQ
ncbi:hypothetical protein CIHG_09587 [Coccidioides immitis H538.4]|uniref:Uncharacterized protein n=3 Tax=Coccidioides immitis TaxID=5501 RepID=A0A0J8R2D8_COCIT|nr:hypothetical protein CIRG_03885 [Coccidioides immitis RMSCC 2394]KMU78911.1 hypothetical protein CISG_07428 [Coccidioides immitis RMSCC 3703]KMU91847.1 hypothetical protein CIHG_09587 [Coccidioides immitis H538.4]